MVTEGPVKGRWSPHSLVCECESKVHPGLSRSVVTVVDSRVPRYDVGVDPYRDIPPSCPRSRIARREPRRSDRHRTRTCSPVLVWRSPLHRLPNGLPGPEPSVDKLSNYCSSDPSLNTCLERSPRVLHPYKRTGASSE